MARGEASTSDYRGGCRPGMRGCRASCGHRRIVEEYRDERIRQEDIAAEESYGYETELKEWLENHPLITFKEYLMTTNRSER